MKSAQKILRYSPFIGLYFLQGAATAYIVGFQKPYLTQVGIAPSQMSWVSVAFFMPFILKIFISHASDLSRERGWGHRGLWIAAGLILTFIGFGLAASANPAANFGFYLMSACIASLGLAISDAVADGLAVETTPEEDEGFVQSSMFAGRALGAIAYSPLLGSVIASYGYPSALLVLMVTATFPLLLVKRLPPEPSTKFSEARNWADVGRFFSMSTVRAFALYAIFYSMLIYGAEGLLTLFLKVRFEVADTALGNFNAIKSLGTFIGAVLAGVVSSRLGSGKTALMGVATLSLASFGVAVVPSAQILMNSAIVWGLLSGFSATGFVAMAMHLTPLPMAATIFSLFMALGNIGGGVGDGLASRWGVAWGFRSIFASFGMMGLLALAFLLVCLRNERLLSTERQTSDTP